MISYDISVIGPSHSGKTTLIRSFLNDPKATPGGYSSSKTVSFHRRKIVLQIYDEPPVDPKLQPYNIPSLLKRNAFMVCFSIYSRKSFEEAGEYIKVAILNGRLNAFFMLVGTHCDVKENKEKSFYAKEEVKTTEGKEEKTRQISYDEVYSFASSLNWSYIETNAREDMKVEEAFETVLKEVVLRFPSAQPLPNNQPRQPLLNRQTTDDDKSCSIF